MVDDDVNDGDDDDDDDDNVAVASAPLFREWHQRRGDATARSPFTCHHHQHLDDDDDIRQPQHQPS